jgi:type IV pilus assembly protein PilY1
MPSYTLNHIQTTTSADNYSDPGYGHEFDVDASPGTGDVYYNSAWHTILVSGLGAGGSALFALDVTNPENTSDSDGPVFSETNASSIVLGDWSTTTNSAGVTTSTLSCAHVTTNASTNAANCGMNLGNTYGTPQIRRFHNGLWGALIGNGFGSSTGDAGIYVMILSASGSPSFYYLSTGQAGKADGIAYVSSADLDGDHVTDYAYAGDLNGNVWRFDLTNSDPTKWAVTATQVYILPSAQPITSKIAVVSVNSTPNQRVMLEFGTGRQIPLSNTSAATYSQSQQSLYGVWDWDLAAWNTASTTQYAVLPFGSVAAPTSALTASGSTAPSNLTAQSMSTVTYGGVDYRTVSSNSVCWAGTTGCSPGSYGWYLPLVSGHANPNDQNLPNSTYPNNPVVYEQVIYSPVVVGDTFIVNTVIPSAASLTNCLAVVAGGFTMAINPGTGGSFASSVFTPPASADPPAGGDFSAEGLSGTGTGLLFTTSKPQAPCTGAACPPPPPTCAGPTCTNPPPPCSPGTNNYLVTQTVSGTPTEAQVNLQCNVTSSRITWIQKR